ncbi:hypothetical protein [Pseudorhodoferax sp. Leaf274]|uniref:hypothetical protein n=1 Tax=Pseudorhodoferax sp. Leaf274 TaxID=1736318 RepID=UPI0007031407|nr:hypothetical protein [Pseudorhodoferax sp. Leaf274]KQP37573.1 hypothetical protein ASF44_14620 [Pseudorhodoferax sp. Leaf274]
MRTSINPLTLPAGASEPAKTASASRPLGTLDKQLAHFYLVQIEQKQQHKTHLNALLDRRKRTRGHRDWQTEDAMRAGAYALEYVIESYVDTVRARGCLLHVGCLP